MRKVVWCVLLLAFAGILLHLPEDRSNQRRRELADLTLVQHLERRLASAAAVRRPA